MNKFKKIINEGREICLNDEDDCRYYHIAYLMKGKKIINYSRNNYNRQYLNGKAITSLHAEIGCMLKFKNSTRIKKGFDIIILRFNLHGELCESKPCNNCKQFLLQKGIHNVYCSLSDGTIQKLKLESIDNYYTASWKKLIGERNINI